ncbi:MAG: efflux RND transporter periplasmic adaptor subunit [Haliea sp.]|nr:efflux RND transporter periplasmic adaptor subunit [Haliea sp.]
MALSRYPRIAVFLVLLLALMLLLGWCLRGPEVVVYRLAAAPLLQTVVASGRIESVSRAQVGSEITGVVLERRIKEGDRVAEGDVLLVLRADEVMAQVQQAEAALDQLQTSTRPQSELALARAQALLVQAQREAERRRDLTARGLLSREALEQAEEQATLARNAVATARVAAASLAPGGTEEAVLNARLASLQAQLAKTIVRSEVAGTVLTRNVEPGDLVQPGRVLFSIALLGDTEILVPLDEKNLAQLALQQPAVVIADAYPERPFTARIDFIAPRVDPQQGTVDVHLQVSPVPDFLREDMTVSVNIETGRRSSTLVLPNDALIAVSGSSAQVVQVQEGRLQRVSVTLGLRGVALSEITEGLVAGDHVLADPSSALPDSSRVRAKEQPLTTDEAVLAGRDRNELPVQFD